MLGIRAMRSNARSERQQLASTSQPCHRPVNYQCQGRRVSDAADVPEMLAGLLVWPAGPRSLFVRVEPDEVRGASSSQRPTSVRHLADGGPQALTARPESRSPCPLFHSALVVHVGSDES